MGADGGMLAFPGNVLSHLYEMREEVKIFSTAEQFARADPIAAVAWCPKLAHPGDVFPHLNNLNRKMQGGNENLLSSADKWHGFRSKLALWPENAAKSKLAMLSLANSADPASSVLANVNFSAFTEFSFYFPSLCIEDFERICDPWSSSAMESTKNISIMAQEQLTELRTDRNF